MRNTGHTMCENKECDWYTRKGWKETEVGDKFGFKSFQDYLSAFMEYHLFGASSLECGCCGSYVDPDGDCGECSWKNPMLLAGVI